MKVNDIRKLAKEIRTGNCTLGYEEMCVIGEEIANYTNSEAAAAWTERTKEIVKADVDDIAKYMMRIAPKEPEYEETEIRRKNWKTVVLEMTGKRYPVLEAVKWFSTVYARDGYEKAKCIKGMVERRGYNTTDSHEGFFVEDSSTGEILAEVLVTGNNVSDFRISA